MKIKLCIKKFLAIFTAISFLFCGNPSVCGALDVTGAYGRDGEYNTISIKDGETPPPSFAAPTDPSSAGPLSAPTPSTSPTATQTNLVTPDKVGPTGSININSGATHTGSSTVTLNLTAADAGSGVAKMTFSNDNINWSTPENYATSKTHTLSAGEGNKTVYVKYLDKLGNTSAVYSSSITLDRTGPTGSININPQIPIYTVVGSRTVTLNLAATDSGSGIEKMMFSNDNVNWSAPENYATSKTYTLSANTTTAQAVYVRYLDRAGNSSMAYSTLVKLDTTPPTGSISFNMIAPISGQRVAMDLSADDVGGGYAKSMSFSTNGTEWSSPEPYSQRKYMILPSGNSFKRVYVKYWDSADNVSAVYSASQMLDIPFPSGTVTVNGGAAITNKATVTLNLNTLNLNAASYGPNLSLSKMSFSNDTVNWSTPENYATSKAYTLPAGDGNKMVQVKYLDQAGNTIADDFTSITLDENPPMGSININNGEVYATSQTVTLNLSATDSGSGVAKMTFSNDNVNWSTPENYATSKTHTLSAGVGNKTVYVKYLDKLGNTSAVYSSSVTLDHTRPTGSININSGAAFTGSNMVMLNLTATDTGSGIDKMMFSDDNVGWSLPENYATSKTHFFGYSDGNKTVYVKYLDKVGNTSAVHSSSIILDRTGPTGSININSGESNTVASRTVTLNLAATDSGSGVDKMMFSNDSVNWSTPENYATSKIYTLSNATYQSVYVKYLDKLGNSSDIYGQSVRLDTTPPTGSISFNTMLGMDMRGQRVAMDLVANDASGSIKNMSFSTNGTEWSSPEKFSTQKYMVLPAGNSLRTVYVKYWDNADNVSTVYSASKMLNIPSSSGTVAVNGVVTTLSGVGLVNKLTVTLNLRAADLGPNLSLSKMSFSNDGINWSTPENYATSKAYTLPAGNGNKTVHVKYMDQAGNTIAVDSTSIMLDETQPTGSFKINSGATHTASSTVTLNLTAADTGSGVAKMTFSNDNLNWSLPQTFATSTSHGLSASDGNKTVYVKYLDQAGNTSAVYSNSITFDTSSPTGSININNGAADTPSRTVTLSLTAVDHGSGVVKMMFSNDNINWSTPENYAPSKTYTLPAGDGNKTVYVRYLDNVGNTSIAYSNSVRLDTTPPTGSISFNTTLATAGIKVAGQRVAIDLVANDAAAGSVTRMSFSTNGTEWSSPEPYATQKFMLVPPGNGPRTVYVKYWDSAGNVSAVYSKSSNLNIPFSSGSVFVNNHPDAVNNRTVTLNVSFTNAGPDLGHSKMSFSNDNINWSTPENYAPSKTHTLPAGDGNKTVYVKYVDQAGKTLALDSVSIMLDETPPTGSININSGASSATSQAVTLNLSASDSGTGGDGISMSFVTDEPGAQWSIPEQFSQQKAIALPPGNGLKTVYVKYFDKAGNASAVYSKSINLNIPPSSGTVPVSSSATVNAVTVAGGVTTVNKTTVTLNLSAVDFGSGLSKMSFSNDNVNWSAPENYATSKAYTLPTGDGNKKVYVKYLDKAGRSSSVVSTNVFLDTTQPTGFINSGVASPASQTVTLNLAAGDPGPTSGGLKMTFSNDNVNWSTPETYAATKIYTLPDGNGSTVYVKYLDAAGNMSIAYSKFIMIDRTPPTGKITINGGSIYTSSQAVSLHLEAYDAGGTGVEKIMFSSDNIKWSEPENLFRPNEGQITSSRMYPLPDGDGNKTVYVKYLDKAGNVSIVYSDTITLDETKPVGSININGGQNHTLSPTVTLNLNGTDSLSGIAKMSFSHNGGSWSNPEPYVATKTYTLSQYPGDGMNTISVQYYDHAGNASNVYSKQILLDTLPPVVKMIKINDGERNIKQRNVSLNLLADDRGLGVDKMSFSTDGKTWTTPENYVATKNWSFPAEDGPQTVYVKFQDKSGKWSNGLAKATVNLYTAKASSAIKINLGAEFTTSRNVTLNLSAPNVGSAIRSMSFSTNGTTWSAPETYATSKNMVLPYGDGVKTVYVKYLAITGRWSSEFGATILMDTNRPTGYVRINGPTSSYYTASRTVTLDLGPENGDAAKMMFSNDNVNWSTPETYAPSKTYTLPAGDGNKTVYVKYLDAAGNISSVFSNRILLDQTPPTGTMTLGSGGYAFTRNVTLNLSVSDRGPTASSDIRMSFLTDEPGAQWSIPEPLSYRKDIILPPGNGLKTVKVKYTDSAGNEIIYSQTVTLLINPTTVIMSPNTGSGK